MTLKVIISGGGTGGHIFPALSIADELKRTVSDIDILFVGAQGKMEMERVPAAGYPIVGLPIMGMPRSLSWKLVKFVFSVLKSNSEATRLVKEFKPDLVVGVGGFASYPILNAAAKQGVSTYLQEQNSYAGVSNKKLSKLVQRICVAYEGMERFFPADKIVETGNPVRQNLLEATDKSLALKAYGLEADKPVIVIVGGSLGARTLNEAVMTKLDMLAQSSVQVVWQTGKFYYEEMIARLGDNKPANLHVYQFLTDMAQAYAAADLVVARAGASTISELCLLGKASILVPSPNVAEDHQMKNAMALVNKQAAELVSDAEGVEKLMPTALQLVNDKEKLEMLRANSLKMAKPNATKDIVEVILGKK
ncbi:MAG: undecaprenyldiphospho-muramoylpentapeptide beta-N-acetylglucosaminyltransferase [Mangrovibacterium sp.]